MLALGPIAVLLLLLPLEPMEPLARIAGFQVSHLEAAAFVLLLCSGLAVLACGRRHRVPLAGAATLLLLAFLLSAAFAEGSTVLPLKFTLRMAAGVAAFFLASLSIAILPRYDWLFASLAIAGAATAFVSFLEIGPWPLVDSLLSSFREQASFEVGGLPRVTATFSYPNTAGGFLVLAIAPTLYFSGRGWLRAAAPAAAVAMFAAILLTYSRGALLGAAASSLALWWMARARGEERALSFTLAASAVMTAGFFLAEPSYRWRTSSEGDRSWYNAEITPSRTKLRLRPGERAKTEVRVANAGKLTWRSEGAKPFHLSYRWFESDGEDGLRPIPIEGERTKLPSTVEPGGKVDLAAVVKAPPDAGTYVLIWDMVHEHTTWFSDKVGLGAPVWVEVGGARLDELAPTAGDLRDSLAAKSWRPGRLELWSIALDLFRESPLLGAGPDNFRWLYGPESGHDSWDNRVFANSLYLELLATVGLLGFAAFGVFVGKALFELKRRAASGPLRAEAAVLAASLSGFLVHGLFDYLLAFTPIYLALFVLLGASSAAIRGEAAA